MYAAACWHAWIMQFRVCNCAMIQHQCRLFFQGYHEDMPWQLFGASSLQYPGTELCLSVSINLCTEMMSLKIIFARVKLSPPPEEA